MFKEGDDRKNTTGGDVDREFVFPYGELLDIFRKAGKKVLTVCVETGGFILVFVGRIDDGGVELPNGYRRCQPVPNSFHRVM